MAAGIYSKGRYRIWNSEQHPYKHSLNDFLYANPSLPASIITLQGSLDYLYAVLYPQTKAAVANSAALPLIGNTINDFRVVNDDGDGKAAAYRWEQREGEAVASWHKIYDFDWGVDSILQQFLTKTQDLYVKNSGNDDLDISGSPIAGLYSGQSVYGGVSAGTSLTLRANSGDGIGPHTGFVQVDDHFRPATDSNWSCGTNTERWSNVFTDSLTSGTLVATSGSITDSSGSISFGNENLTTIGDISGAVLTASTSLKAIVAGETITVVPGSITCTTGAISFGNENLSTTGTISGATGSTFGTLTLANGSITASGGAITFDNENLSTTGTLGAGNTTVTRLDSDNIRIDGNTISILNVDGNLNLVANGTGVIDLQSAIQTLGQTVTGVIGITGQLNIDNLRFDGNVISSTNLNGNITFTPNGSGIVETSASINPSANGTLSLGDGTHRFSSLFLATGLNDGSNSISMSTLLSLRDINVGVTSGMSLFWDGAKWVASAPDTEITHNTLSGLTTTDAGHTQFVLLAGRAGGQTIQGGTLASQNLTLESTAHATKGNIYFKDSLFPFTNASYSTQWDGEDFGSTINYLRDIYSKGQHFGLRLENLGADPSPSVQNIGRVFYNTAEGIAKLDTGTAIKTIGNKSYSADTVWNGTDLTKTVTVSGSVNNARNCLWQLCDNTNDFEIIFCKITKPSTTQITITLGTALPAGNYQLIGIEI